MTEFGITGYGAYIPRLRLERTAIAAAHAWMAPSLKGLAKGARSFCGWDEDAITMAVEAGRDCLGSRAASGIEGISLASTSLPYADLQNCAIAATAIGLDRSVASVDLTGSQRCGTSGLRAALQGGTPALFVASDKPRGRPASTQEMTYGAGAAAFTLGNEGVIARLLGASTQTVNFVDHFRATDADYDYFWEERWIRDEGYQKLVPAAIKDAIARSNVTMADITHFVMPSPMKGVADAVAKKVGFAGAMVDTLDAACGYAGAAHPLLQLALVLETAKPGDTILVASFGQGADALVLRVTEAISKFKPAFGVSGRLADAISTDAYLRMLSFEDAIELEWGMRSERSTKTMLTEQYRSAHMLEGFVAGQCGACGTVQFPQLQACVKCQAPATQFSAVSLKDAPAKVLTSTADWLSYYAAPPLYAGFVQFDNGARMVMEMVDVGPSGIDRDTPLRMVFRIKERDKQRGYSRYFWKATPVRAS